MTSRHQLPRLALAVAGAAVLVAYGIARLPKRASLLALSSTPIDYSGNSDSAPRFRLLTEAARALFAIAGAAGTGASDREPVSTPAGRG